VTASGRAAGDVDWNQSNSAIALEESCTENAVKSHASALLVLCTAIIIGPCEISGRSLDFSDLVLIYRL
jgi:hypothetical protein